VFLGVPRDIYPIVAVKCDAAMPFPLPGSYEEILKKAAACDVALIGPGLGRGEATDRLALGLLKDLDIPVVLDADGLNALAGRLEILDGRKALTVLTPPEGEFQRLTGCRLPIEDRVKAAKDFAAAHRCVLVLKGPGTVTADWKGNVWVNDTGGPGMAKGGSGDVLAGMLAALLGQKHLKALEDPGKWMALGVWCHGAAGDRCAKRLGEYAMTPGDLLDELPHLLRELEEYGKA
jgi:NAD(P)H-hydrate epimerase